MSSTLSRYVFNVQYSSFVQISTMEALVTKYSTTQNSTTHGDLQSWGESHSINQQRNVKILLAIQILRINSRAKPYILVLL